MRFSLILALLASLLSWSHPAKRQTLTKAAPPEQTAVSSPTEEEAGHITVTGQTAGPTPFTSLINFSITPHGSLQKIKFTITPKPGSVTRPVSAVYWSDYLQSRGYLTSSSGTIPVFGLYAGYVNTVTLSSTFADGSTDTDVVMVTTGAFNGACSATNPGNPGTPIVLQQRTNNTDLSYDYMLLKNNCANESPAVVDTDGALRWVGTSGTNSFGSMFFDNAIYMSAFPPSPSTQSGINRIEFDGTFALVHDYAGSNNVTLMGHHNFDPGKDGMLVEVDTTNDIESVILEVDPCGGVLRTWNFGDIIRNAMIAGGDDPTGFVRPASSPSPDWFHNNAATYRKSDDSLVVSSREDFVICVDYETGAIKWILGDPTKKWHQYASLRQYELALGPNTLPPIGQHAVSITADDNLLLFDNGTASLNQTPAGASRTYSAARKYHIDLQNKIATEVWNFTNGQTVFSQFCSSVYEDGPQNYLIDYANVGPSGSQFARILGLNAAGTKIFDYQYTTTGCQTTWNAIPIHFESMQFFGPDPKTRPGGWRIASITKIGSAASITVPGLGGKTYRLQYKNALSDATWQTVTDVTLACSKTVRINDPTAGSLPRFYRILELP